MNWIELRQCTDDGGATVCVDASQIDYVKPHQDDCSLHFINGDSIWVKENMKSLKEALKGWQFI